MQDKRYSLYCNARALQHLLHAIKEPLRRVRGGRRRFRCPDLPGLPIYEHDVGKGTADIEGESVAGHSHQRACLLLVFVILVLGILWRRWPNFFDHAGIAAFPWPFFCGDDFDNVLPLIAHVEGVAKAAFHIEL